MFSLSDVEVEWHDISMPLHASMVVYEGDPPFELEGLCGVEVGVEGSFSLSGLSLTTHTGTHIDPPSHFVAGGEGVDGVSLELLCGPCVVLDASGCGALIGVDLLRGAEIGSASRVLFKTDNARLWGGPFSTDWTALSLESARYLVEETQVRLVGIDYLSIEAADSPGFPVHRQLLGADPAVIVLEGVDLREVAPGAWNLVCLPLKIVDGDGGPARALVWRSRFKGPGG